MVDNMSDGEMKMTYSAILRDKDDKKIVRVQFERKNGATLEVAEGVLPEGRIVKQNGYSPDEVKGLEKYLMDNSDDIIARAKVISNPLKWL